MYDFYILFFILSAILFLIDWQVFNLNSPYLKGLLSTIFILFAGLRHETGWDYEAYDYFFEQISKIPIDRCYLLFSDQIAQFEPLFTIVSYISVKIGVPVYLVISIITTTCYASITNRYFKRNFYLIFLAYVYYGYFHQFSIIRQGLSISILYVAFISCRGHKRLYLSILSFFIHYSSILSIMFFYLATKIKVGPKYLTLVILFTLPPVLFKTDILTNIINLVTFEKYSSLTELDFLNYKVGISLKYLETIVLLVGVEFYKLKQYPNLEFCANLLLIELLNYSIFNDITIIYERYNVVFEFAHGIVLSYIILKVVRNQLLAYVCILVFISYRYFQFFNSESRNHLEKTHYERFFPYKTINFKN